jgi:hypothetical protein
MIDSDQDPVRMRLLDPLDPWQPPVKRLIGDEFPVPRRVKRRVRALVHREVIRMHVGAQEFRFRAGDVGDWMQSDRLGHDAAPSRIERAQDVAVGLGWRGRRQQKWIPKLQPGKSDRQVGCHGPSVFGSFGTRIIRFLTRFPCTNTVQV